MALELVLLGVDGGASFISANELSPSNQDFNFQSSFPGLLPENHFTRILIRCQRIVFVLLIISGYL